MEPAARAAMAAQPVKAVLAAQAELARAMPRQVAMAQEVRAVEVATQALVVLAGSGIGVLTARLQVPVAVMAAKQVTAETPVTAAAAD